MGFEQSHADPCVFRKFDAEEIVVILVIYVDDFLALTTPSEKMESLVEELRSRYKIENLGETSYYMDCHMTRKREK